MNDRGRARWLDEREQRAWRGFVAMQTQLRARIRQALQHDAGLSDADYEVLVHLSEAPDGRLRVFQLGRALQWEKSRLSHQLRRMAERGLVDRAECPTDARGNYVVITDAGRAAIEAAAPGHVAEVRRAFIDIMTPEQLDALTEITAAVLANLEGDQGAGAGSMPGAGGDGHGGGDPAPVRRRRRPRS